MLSFSQNWLALKLNSIVIVVVWSTLVGTGSLNCQWKCKSCSNFIIDLFLFLLKFSMVTPPTFLHIKMKSSSLRLALPYKVSLPASLIKFWQIKLIFFSLHSGDYNHYLLIPLCQSFWTPVPWAKRWCSQPWLNNI